GHRRTVEVAADALRPDLLTVGGVVAGDDAAIAPDEQTIAHRDRRRDLRKALLQLEGHGRFGAYRIAWLHGLQVFAVPPFAAPAEDHPRRNERRVDASRQVEPR